MATSPSTPRRPRNPSRNKPAAGDAPRLSRHRRPAELPVPDWQLGLRRQFGREQAFEWRNLGSEPLFSDFAVHNPESRSSYVVRIRGAAAGANSCTCPDYATNHLGSCKHIEFVLGRLSRRRGGKTALARGFTPAFSELRLDHAGPRRVRFAPGSDCPPTLLAAARKLFDAESGWSLHPGKVPELTSFARSAEQAGHELRVEDAVWQFSAQLRDAEQRRQRIDQAYPKGAEDPALARLLKVPLYRYQAEGALFAARAGRALIGDEMGLGKTVQAIAAAELMARHFGVQRVLVVCPTSLKHQWKNEFARFTERTAQAVQGLRAVRERQFAEDSFAKITNYDTLARDADLIEAWSPDLVIADEAQRIKNWNTIAARALKRVASPYAVVLTGTPLENRLEELISIVQFVDQQRLGPTWRLLDAHQERDDSGRVVGYRALDRLGQSLAPILVRRRKAEVLAQLPERVDQRIYVPLTPEQREHHDENGLIVARIVARWRQTGFLSDADQHRLHCALQNMRMACNSTWLLDHHTDHGHKVDELMALLDEILLAPDAKAVVFSQWRGTHELIVRRLAARGWGHVQFDGSVPGEQRGALVERFHHDPQCRLFLSTDAGGVGLNLQHAAAVVVNMDLPWNPAVLEQRIGRVHRMGQRRGVQVVQFVGQGSIEEGMLSVLAFKSSLFAGVLDGGESEVFLNGSRLSQFLRSVEDVTASMGEPDATPEATPEAASETTPEAPPDATQEGPPERPPDPAPETMLAGAVDIVPEAVGEAVAEAVVADGGPEARSADSAAAPDGVPASAPAGMPLPLPAAAGAADPWPALLQAGATLLQGLAQAAARPGASGGLRIEPDPQTGQPSVRLPLPAPEVLRELLHALEPWLRR